MIRGKQKYLLHFFLSGQTFFLVRISPYWFNLFTYIHLPRKDVQGLPDLLDAISWLDGSTILAL
jgi:hypothetical protein